MMKRWTKWVMLLLPLFPVNAEDPFLDRLKNRGNDRDAILREFGELESRATVTPPPKKEPTTTTTPIAQPPQFVAPKVHAAPRKTIGASPLDAPLQRLALILPTHANGLTAAVAQLFHEGCLRGLHTNEQPLAVDLYPTDGSPQAAVAAYRQALTEAPQFVVGPMQKNAVAALQEAFPRAPTPTLLLQQTDGDDYYVLTMDAAAEAAELARWLSEFGTRALLVSDNSPLSRRQADAFAAAWQSPGAATTPPARFYVHNPAKDWKRLFEQLKEETLAAESEENAAAEALPPLILFAAGNGAFVRQVRSYAPQGYPVFAGSIFYGVEQGGDALFLENLRAMEMPWFLPNNAAAAAVDSPLVRSRPTLQQRFYALGVDVCRVVQQAPQWFDGWQFPGVSGMLTLDNGAFRRRGVLVQYQAGLLLPLTP